MTHHTYDNIDDLLIKVILQEASSDELDYVRGWVGLDPANERYFSDFKRIWAESRHLAIHSRINEEDAWQDFQQRIPAGSFDAGGDTDMPDSQVVNMPLRRNYTWLRVAAVFITLLAGGWLYYRYGSKQDQYLSIHSNKNVLSDTLSEGTVVTLNKESSIRYSRLFAGDTRPVELEGEAFFNVTPDKNKPFIVHTQETSIRVLGTSFNVRNTGETTEVIVETGMVEVTNGQHTVRVRAHEKAVIGKKDQPPVKEDIHDELYNYYRTNEFECNGTPLWRMVEKLNEVYKGHIVIGDTQLRDLPLTTTFRVGDESLDEILQVIAQTLKLKITRDGQKIILN